MTEHMISSRLVRILSERRRETTDYGDLAMREYLEREIGASAEDAGIALTPAQKAAVDQALGNEVVVIEGPARTGKSQVGWIVAKVWQKYADEIGKKTDVLLLGATGRSVHLMQSLHGEEARTVHGALKAIGDSQTHLGWGLAIVEGADMLDDGDLADLLDRSRGRVVVLIGDAARSVNAKGTALDAAIATGLLATARLQEVLHA